MKDELLENGINLINNGLRTANLHKVENFLAVVIAMGTGDVLLDADNQQRLADHLLFLIGDLLENNITNLDNCEIPPYPVGRPRKDISNRVKRVAELIISEGSSRNKAYKRIAEFDNVSESTVKTQYLSYEKELIEHGLVAKLP